MTSEGASLVFSGRREAAEYGRSWAGDSGKQEGLVFVLVFSVSRLKVLGTTWNRLNCIQ